MRVSTAVRTGPASGLVAQLALLAVLGAGRLGWAVGLGWAVVVTVALDRGLARAGRHALGPADRVTLARAVLVGGVAALVTDSLTGELHVVTTVALCVLALLLDAVDGFVARMTGTASPLGARFDMEVDAFLILVLSIAVARGSGAWVLLIGLARYLLWLAERVMPWLRLPVPPRHWRKAVAAIQGITLTVAVGNVLPAVMTTTTLLIALLLLAESFGQVAWWQWHAHRGRTPLDRREFRDWRRARHVRATPAAEGAVMTAHTTPHGLDGTGIDQIRAPWLLYLDGTALTVRGAVPQDLPGVALMHGRCSAKSLLDRYRTGGRAPAIIVLDRHVRDPLSFVVTTDDGRVVALSRVAPDVDHSFGSAEISMLVEDQWQRLGVGRSLLRHTAAAAALAGYRQLISYPGTTSATVQRLMGGVGTTRPMTDGQRHLHTALSEHTKRGLGLYTDGGAAARAVHALG